MVGFPAICDMRARITGPERGFGHRAQRIEDRREQLLASVTGLGDADVRAGKLGEQLLGERLLGAPAPVDRGLPDPGPSGDVLEAEIREPLLGEQLARRVEDLAVDHVAARPAGACLRRGNLDRSVVSPAAAGTFAMGCVIRR